MFLSVKIRKKNRGGFGWERLRLWRTRTFSVLWWGADTIGVCSNVHLQPPSCWRRHFQITTHTPWHLLHFHLFNEIKSNKLPVKSDLSDGEAITHIRSAVGYSRSRFTCGQETCGAGGVNEITALCKWLLIGFLWSICLIGSQINP